MKNNKHIKIEDALNSLDGAERAVPQLFLFTRVMARINAAKENSWERAGKLISRPSIAVGGLAIMLALNIMVVVLNHYHVKNSNEAAAFVTTGDLPSASITVNNIENP